MNISKVNFQGNLANYKVDQNRLVIGDKTYKRGDKVAITNKNCLGRVTPAEIKDFIVSRQQKNILLIYKNLSTDKFEHVGTVSPENYDIYDINEIRKKIMEKADELYEWRDAIAEIAPKKHIL